MVPTVAVDRAEQTAKSLLAKVDRVESRTLVVHVKDSTARLAWEVVVAGGRQLTGLDGIAWIERAVELGAGEVLLTSIDRDGTQAGFDLELLQAVTARVDVPVIASGGAGSPADMVAALAEGGADAVLAASIFHRDIHSIAAVKEAMAAAGVPVRPIGAAA